MNCEWYASRDMWNKDTIFRYPLLLKRKCTFFHEKLLAENTKSLHQACSVKMVGLLSVLLFWDLSIWCQKHISMKVCSQCFSAYISSKKRPWLKSAREPTIHHEFWSEDSLVQQLSLKHRNLDAQAQLNYCIGGLLHLGPTVFTFRTSTRAAWRNLIGPKWNSHCRPRQTTMMMIMTSIASKSAH